MSTDNDRISISRSDLRAELAQLELRLVDRLTDALTRKADHVVVEQIETRVGQLELSLAERRHLTGDVLKHETRIGRLEKFRYAMPSVGAISLIIGIASLYIGRL